MGDLEGVLVVSVEQAVAAPVATARLADAGARVIKIERPDGDFARGYDDVVHGESAYFVWANRGKESICLDLRDDGDHALATAMTARADVFVQNLAPGAAARLGLGADAMRALNPRLIYVSISGYGEEGPYRDQKAYDMLVQGESGLLSVNGTPDGNARVGISVCDIAAGETAFAAVLQSLLARGRTGLGRAVEVSLFHTMADWMNVPYLHARYGGKAPALVGLRHPTIAPYGAFRCGDGRDVLLSVQNEREWLAFCERILERPGLARDPRFRTNSRRIAHLADLESLIAPVFLALDREAAMRRLQDARIACGRLSTMAEMERHPQARHIEVATPTGPVELMARGVVFADGADAPRRPAVPGRGEHTAALRREFAASAAQGPMGRRGPSL